ncbi:hypothetical protein [Rhodoferax sp. PAMC 29310]|uniref:hypothetical protein n=1 Tax=Rhodoferax sp. PAMC 29310 TaxID=2822760 RepID=UPI001B31F5BC|nr:hypothetical protein [Rhodoferax sp. PAMC 29310]
MAVAYLYWQAAINQLGHVFEETCLHVTAFHKVTQVVLLQIDLLFTLCVNPAQMKVHP